MDHPFYYQHENYVLLFIQHIEEIQKYKLVSEEMYVRCMVNGDEKWEDVEIPQIYMDEMNEEILIKKAKRIIYTLSYQLESNRWIEYVKQFQKEMDIENDLQIISYEDLPQKCKIEGKKEMIHYQIQNPSFSNMLPKINLITYIRRMQGNDMYYQLQIKCILENYKHHSVENILVIGMGVEETFQKIHYEKIVDKKLILINDNDDNISFSDIFTIMNGVFQDKIVMIMRSDIIFLQCDDITSLCLDLMYSDKKIISLSRIDRDMQGRLVKQPPQQTFFGGSEQDAWIIRSPVMFQDEEIEMIEKIDFNERYSELYMNYFMRKQGYKIVHDTRDYKILRICLHSEVNVRDLMKHPSREIDKKKMDLIPDMGYIENINMDQWVQMMSCSEDDIYEMKMEWMNRFYRRG